MTIRLPVNTKKVLWREGQTATEQDLDDEQSFVTQSDSAIVNNFFGSGLLLESPSSNVIFDTDDLTSAQAQYESTGDFDGRGLDPHSQPTDVIYGNQLRVTLTDSNVGIRECVKVFIIGTDFQNQSQYESFVFHVNETQVGKKHFRTVISVLFNDFKGNDNGSRLLDGRVVIQEARTMEASRDSIMASQNIEPNLLWRDFKVFDTSLAANPSMYLSSVLALALTGSGFDVDSLNINVGYVAKKSLAIADISTRYGQKFLAKTNNIQKIRVLLAVDRDYSTTDSARYDWSGDLIVSVHALQTSVTCPTDTIPVSAIEYSPMPSALAQVIITQDTLMASGFRLTDVLQPIDVVFTNTKIGQNTNTGITSGNYYIVTVQRAGDTTVGSLFTVLGRNFTDNSQFSEFNGSTWTDDAEKDMWFEVYSDCVKIASGNCYDAGAGCAIDKTTLDSSGAAIDYSFDGISFASVGQNVTNNVIVQAVNEQTDQGQDSRTGNNIWTRERFSADVSVITTAQLTTLRTSEEPIVLGSAVDKNNRSTTTVTKSQTRFGLANGKTFDIINPATEAQELLVYNLYGSKLTLDGYEYLVSNISLCTDGYFDLNSDGYVGSDDILRLSYLLTTYGPTLDLANATTQNNIAAGYFTALEVIRSDINGDGVVNATDLAIAQQLYDKDPALTLPYGSTFSRLRLTVDNLNGRWDGYHHSFENYAQLWQPLATQVAYGTAPLLAGSVLLPYYGYPVPIDLSTLPSFATTPYVATNYVITITPCWYEEMLKVNFCGRYLPCAFSSNTGNTVNNCSDPTVSYCTTLPTVTLPDGGKNDMFVPGDLIINDGGNIKNLDGTNYKVDFEVSTVTLILPAVLINQSIDIFTTFVAESANGFTSKGFVAKKFSDCSYVSSSATTLNQVRFTANIGSIMKNLDGYDVYMLDGYGIIEDPNIGVYIDNDGILTVHSGNINEGIVEDNCKVNVTVYLKKGGFVNQNTVVDPSQVEKLFGL